MDDETSDSSALLARETVDAAGLRRETARRLDRATKKVSKKSARLSSIVDDPALTEEALECEALLLAASLERAEFALLEAALAASGKSVSDEALAMANALGVGDAPPARGPRGPAKTKGPSAASTGPRLPYARYASTSGVEIRVGRSARDNDELSCNPLHRDSSDWWMHASGSAGSHVVIRTDDAGFGGGSDRETALDAAVLAVLFSKVASANYGQPAPGDEPNAAGLPSGFGKVTLTRARDVKKPNGAKPGLVQLTGDVSSVGPLDLQLEKPRILRLLRTRF